MSDTSSPASNEQHLEHHRQDSDQHQHDQSDTSPPNSQHDQSQDQELEADVSVSMISNANQIDDNDLAGQSKHPRARRKRTNVQDKMILEDAYRRNSKPDKAARMDLVSRVSLTEKEVQVWFQNRRQNDRRKSRPISAQELANLHYNHIRPVNGEHMHESVLKVVQGPVSVHDPIQTTSVSSPPPHNAYSPYASGAASHQHSRSFSEATSYHTRLDLASSQDSLPSSQESKSAKPLTYLANRRRHNGSVWETPPLQHTRSFDSFTFRAGDLSFSSADSFKHSQDKTGSFQSQMRLSCSLDGKAALTPHGDHEPLGDSASDHAPHAPEDESPLARSHNGLQRSHSVTAPSVAGPNLPGINHITRHLPPLPPRLPRGRSRNVQAWESCASSETRDELTAMAENESNGSAAASISLIRSSSAVSNNGGAGNLQVSGGSKRNAHLASLKLRQTDAAEHQAKRPKLSRASSSIAKLGGSTGNSEKIEPEKADKPEKEVENAKGTVVPGSPGDSDKENWSPDEDGAARNSRRRPLPSTIQAAAPKPSGQKNRRVLADSKGGRSLLNIPRSNTTPVRRGKGQNKDVAIFEDSGSKLRKGDDEVEKFMRGEVSPSKRPDMDVVEGLLSLREGAWR